MALFRGATELKKFYIGGTEYKKLFRGATEIFSAANVVTITLPGTSATFSANHMSWVLNGSARINLGTILSEGGRTTLYLAQFRIPLRSTVTFQIALARNTSEGGLVGGPDFSSQMESDGSITLANPTAGSVVVSGIGDATEPYSWVPSNNASINTFANALLPSRVDRTVTVTFNDSP